MAEAAAKRGDLRNYALVTGAYWADTLADGAISPALNEGSYDVAATATDPAGNAANDATHGKDDGEHK